MSEDITINIENSKSIRITHCKTPSQTKPNENKNYQQQQKRRPFVIRRENFLVIKQTIYFQKNISAWKELTERVAINVEFYWNVRSL